MSSALKDNKDKYQLVIGIDFGTSRSGFAYGWMNEQTSEQRVIYFHTKWPGQPFEYVKTTTLLLYCPDKDIKWGYEARKTLMDNKGSAQYHLFERFKMKLYYKEKYYESNGQKFLVLDLISDYLRKLKDYALNHITGGMVTALNENKILWCLTIPAMWDATAKDVMINAAIKAGLIKSISDYPERLVFVLEPEAAVIYCQHKDAVASVPELNMGTRFMVVDAGDETVDITVHKVSPEGLKAVAKSMGAAHGSTYVDQDFHRYLERLLTPEFVKKLAKEEPGDYEYLKDLWEQNKCAFDENKIRRGVSSRIPIPRSISKKWPDEIFENLSQNQDGDEDNIVLSPDVMKGIFKGTLDKLIATVDQEFSALDGRGEKCDYLFLVGGFAHYPLLQKRIRERYEGTRVQKVVIPVNPGSAILWGAVSYGIDPSVIRSRSSCLTYGIESMPLPSFPVHTLPYQRPLLSSLRDLNRSTASMPSALKDNKNKYQLVISIDFGTSRSGFAYGWMNEQTSEQRAIYLHTKWPGQPTEIEYVKTPTLLLYSPNTEEKVSWGYEARKALINLAKEDEAKKNFMNLGKKDSAKKEYHLFERFKMKLYYKQEYYESDGQKFLVLDLISDYLRKLKDYALDKIFGRMGNLISDNKILWCLTIPAMWELPQKNVMIDAALKAGLIKNRSDYGERLVFVLEPEAAAIYCQHQDAVTSVPALNMGTRFMVVDAGGGTVDITVHKVSSKGLEALAKSLGAAHGSTYVDQDFQIHLEKLLTPEFVKKIAKEKPGDYELLKALWEQIKCKFDLTQIQRNEISLIDIPTRISKNWPDEIFENLSRQQNGRDDSIILYPNVMERIFQGTLNKLISKVDEAFSELDLIGEKCDYLFLVGGFAHSPLLQKQIRERYEGTKVKRVVIPNNPGAAILRGAVSYGIDPSVIRSRSSCLTYGIATRMPFDESLDKHKPSKKVWNKWENQYYCEDRFSIFVRAGEIVEVGKKVTKIYNPTEPDQTNMLIKIYSTKQEYVRYIDDSSVSYEAEIKVDIPNTSGGINRKVEVTMDFSETLITATAKDLNSGSTYPTEVRFSRTYFS